MESERSSHNVDKPSKSSAGKMVEEPSEGTETKTGAPEDQRICDDNKNNDIEIANECQEQSSKNANDKMEITDENSGIIICEQSEIEDIPSASSNADTGHNTFIANDNTVTSKSPNDPHSVEADSRNTFLANVHRCFENSPVEISSLIFPSNRVGENYLRGCKWSPDGTCLMTNSNDNSIRIFNLPVELYIPDNINPVGLGEPVIVTQEPEVVYDFCWYPLLNSACPDTCKYISTCRDNPVHLWDAFTGSLRGVYRAHNAAEEIVCAHSVCLTGDKVLCGYEKTIREFDIERPGTQCRVLHTYDKSTCEGQFGIISCIASTWSHTFAAGSYNKSIGIYDARYEQVCDVINGHRGGITHLMFTANGLHLFSGGRKDSDIRMWDLRNLSTPSAILNRSADTNQRFYFDLDDTGRYLVSGDTTGHLNVWSVTDLSVDGRNEPHNRHKIHDDASTSVALHQGLPLLATGAGQRKFPLPMSQSEDSTSYLDDETMADEHLVNCTDNTLKIWSLV